MTEQEGLDIITQTAVENTESLDRTIQTLGKTDLLAGETLTKLQMQKERLLHMDDDLDCINASLKRSEKSIKRLNAGMITSGVLSVFGKRKKSFDTPKTTTTTTTTTTTNDNPDGTIMMPANVHGEDDLKDIIKKIEEKKYVELKITDSWQTANNEKALYHCGLNPLKDEIDNCILLTTHRFLKIEKAKVIVEIVLPSIKKIEYQNNGKIRSDQLIFTTQEEDEDPKVEKCEIWSSDVALFFKEILSLAIGDLPKRRKNRKNYDLEKRAKSRGKTFKGKKTSKYEGKTHTELGMSKAEFEAAKSLESDNSKLDTIGQMMKGIQEKAEMINSELTEHADIIDNVDKKLEQNNAQLKKNNEGANKVLKKKSWF